MQTASPSLPLGTGTDIAAFACKDKGGSNELPGERKGKIIMQTSGKENSAGAVLHNTGRDLTDVLDEAQARGYEDNFVYKDRSFYCDRTGEHFDASDSWIVETVTVDMGTDPGDDSTVYLIRSDSGRRGYVVVPASIYADPGKSALIDRLRAHPRSASD
jgi:hypothetical protein